MSLPPGGAGMIWACSGVLLQLKASLFKAGMERKAL